MSELKDDANFENADLFYYMLLSAHEGLTRQQSEAMNARLILTLANHIGDLNVLSAAINLAKDSGEQK